MKLFTVYITSKRTTICEVAKKGKMINLYQTFRTDTPKGCVEDGIIIDVPTLAEAIKKALPEKNYQRHKIIFSVSSRRIANKEIAIPYVKNKKTISEIIAAGAQDYFPMSNINDYVYDYTILETFEENEKKQYRISAVAVQKELLASYQELAKELKLGLAAIDYYGNSVFQIIKHQVDAEGSTLVLQMEKDVTQVNILTGKAQAFRRSIPFGERAIVQAVAELKQISEKDASKILHESGKGGSILTGDEYKEVSRDIVSSIIRVLDFHVSRNPDIVIEKAKLFGTGAGIAGLAELLERELNIQVSVPKKLEGIAVKGADVLMGVDITDYLANLGAAMEPLNLKSEEEEKESIDKKRIYAISLAGAAVISLVMVAVTLVPYFQLKARKADLEAEIEKIKDVEQIYEEFQKETADYNLVTSYYAMTISRNESLYQMIDDLERTMPESVGITLLDTKEGAVNLAGIADGKEAIADFVIVLKRMPYVSDIQVKDVTDVYDELGNATSTFNMSFQLQTIAAKREEE